MKTYLVPVCIAALLPVLNAAAGVFQFESLGIHVPDGFVIERAAGPPLVDRPISAAFDDAGRLYVTDSNGMGTGGEKQLEANIHRVLRLEDTDGDGKFDQRTVFADAVAFPEGCLWYRGSVYVAAPPEIWKFTDADGDGVAENRQVWFDGRTLTHCGNDLHGPYLGRDGWFYWAKGAYAEQHYTLPGGRRFDTRAAHIFRARPDASGIEPVLTGGMDNPVGVAFTADGGRFLSGTFFENPAAGKRDGLIHSIYGGVYGKVRDTIFEHAMTGGVMPVLTQMGAAAPCGITCVRSAGPWRDQLLTCYFNLHKVGRHELVADGATFRTKDSDFVWSDAADFHPTDVVEDADGSFLVLDTGGWYKVCCPTSQLAKPDVLGAIYRVRKSGSKPVADARGVRMAWKEFDAPALARLLDDARFAVRERAIEELAMRGDAAVPTLAALLRESKSVEEKLGALWALCRIGSEPALASARTALGDADDAVIHAAALVAAPWRDRAAAGKLIALLAHRNPAVVRAAAEALGRIGDAAAVPALLETVARLERVEPAETGAPADPAPRVLEHSLIYALLETGDTAALAKSLDAPDARVRRAALVALDQMKSGALRAESVAPLLEHRDAILRLTAAWIVGHHPEWGGEIAGHFRKRLENPPPGEAGRTTLERQIASLAKAPAIQDLLTRILSSGYEVSMRVALRAAAASGLNPAPGPWLDAIAALLEKSPSSLLPDVVAAARSLSPPKGGHAAFTSALVAAGGRSDAAAQVRLDALSAAGAGVGEVDGPAFDFLLRSLDPAGDMLMRSAAAGILAKARLTVEQQLSLASAVKNVGPLECPKLLPAFERRPGEPLGMKLVAALKDSPGLRGLRPDLLKALLEKYPPTVRDAGQPLLVVLNADAGRQAAHLDSLVAGLPAGELRRGQEVFTRAGCLACHTIGYQGGRLGPDVTNIGKVRNQRDLLEAVVFPNASIVRGYESFLVTTKSGETFLGTIAKDAADEVVLNTGPQTQQRIARGDLFKMEPAPLSLMPQGFGEMLSRQELADLIAFLMAARR